MNAPRLTKATLKAFNVLYSTPDEHAFIKLLNDAIEAQYNSNLGHCEHRPATPVMAKVTGDLSAQYNLCVLCQNEIEPVTTYRLRTKLPSF